MAFTDLIVAFNPPSGNSCLNDVRRFSENVHLRHPEHLVGPVSDKGSYRVRSDQDTVLVPGVDASGQDTEQRQGMRGQAPNDSPSRP